MYKKQDFEQAAAYIATGKCLVDPLITHHFPFARYAEAYELITGRKEDFVKVMIDL
jgi:threonine dehydrogenase-like Zn-dependent dehydrogenase